jgi:Tol biopolymer transport system component
MRYAMSRSARTRVRQSIRFLIAAGLLVSLLGCAAGLPTPTVTAIPLAATATPRPRPSRPPTEPLPTASPTSERQPSPTPISPAGLSVLDDLLAERTVQGFLARLKAGETARAGDLYLTERAQQGDTGQLVLTLVEGTPGLTAADLLEIRRATATSYTARALLGWAGGDGSGPATQTMTLTLTYERGLWLIDAITLGERQSVTFTPVPSSSSRSGRRRLQLAGKLAFQVSSGGDVYVINADGSGLLRLTDGLDPAWSPDGSQIAFTRWRHPWGVYLIEMDGVAPSGPERRVLDGIQLKEVAWSPDGSRIAFTINVSSAEPITICFFGICFTLPPFSFGQMWMANLSTGELLSLPLDDRAVHAPTWNPPGYRIVYAGDRGLAWIDLEDMEKGRFKGGSVWDTSPSFSPDGQQIAFMGRVHNRWEIFVMNADGTGRRQLTASDPKLEAPPSNVAPAWSPDGNEIAFLSNRDGPWRIYVMGKDGSQQRPMFGDRLDSLGIRYEFATERVMSWGP